MKLEEVKVKYNWENIGNEIFHFPINTHLKLVSYEIDLLIGEEIWISLGNTIVSISNPTLII